MGKPGEQPFEISEIVRTVELAPLSMDGNGDDVRLRVEILKAGRGKRAFTARVWRLEFYRVQPTFPQLDGRPASHASDEQVLVIDDNFGDGVWGATAATVLAKVLSEIEERFGGGRTTRKRLS